MLIRPEEHADYQAIGELLEAAFAGPAEAAIVRRLRADGDVAGGSGGGRR